MRLFTVCLLLLAACATTSGGVRRCPGSNQTACLTREICSYDSADNCNRCRCEDAYLPPSTPVNPNQPPVQPYR